MATGKRADGKTTITFVVDETIKRRLRELARAEKRTLSNYLAVKLEEMVVQEEKSAFGKRPPPAKQ